MVLAFRGGAHPGSSRSRLAGLLAGVVIYLFLAPGAGGLVVYRLGAAAVRPPVELGGERVEFIQVPWTDLNPETGGQAFQLDLDREAIRALSLDPQQNLAVAAGEQGGVYKPHVYTVAFDGDLGTWWLPNKYLCAEFTSIFHCDGDYGFPGTIHLDLGGRYPLDRIRIISGLANPLHVARNFRIHVAAEVPRLQYDPDPFRPVAVEVRDNREAYRDVWFPGHEKVGFLQVAMGEHNEDWEVHEIEVYAKGYVDRSTYQSNVIDFGRPMAWGDLRWSGSRGSQAQVLIQTRSGEDEDPLLYWRFTGRGTEKEQVSRVGYQGLKVGEKAGTSYDQEHWTFWSAPYEFGDSLGAAVVSLSPRRYFQFKVDFLPQDEQGAEVGYVELRASPPLASNLVGEVWPVEVGVGEEAQFTYVVRPTIQGGDGGFDRLEIRSSSLLVGVESVRVGDEAVPLEVESLEPHRLAVGVPRLGASDSGALVEVVFRAQVLRYGTTFEGRVWDSGRPLEVPQGVNAGDATGAYEGNGVSVATQVEKESLLSVVVRPGVVTPNGDGVNDEVEIAYEVLEITGVAQVKVEVRDLSGRLVRQLYAGADGIGHYPRSWDGRDEQGQLVSPGVYVYRVSLDADDKKVDRVGLFPVAY